MCSKIKCVARRKLITDDKDDMQFKPDTATPNTMSFSATKSYVLLNQGTITTNKRILETFSDATITIYANAIATSFAYGLAALTAFTLF